MIDFNSTDIKFEDMKPYYIARGAKGKFQRVYLNAEEQQAHKEWDIKRRAALDSAAVASATRNEAQIRTLSSGYGALGDGPTGAVGPGPGPTGIVYQAVLPDALNSDEDTDLPAAQRVARRSVSLLTSIANLSSSLYAFGAVEGNEIGDVIHTIMTYDQCDEIAQEDSCEDSVIAPNAFMHLIASNMQNAYNDPRSESPMFVVAQHAAPVITLAQYLMGITFPAGDMAIRASRMSNMYRKNDDLRDLVVDLSTVYNNIQADIGYAGEQLVGVTPEEIGSDVSIHENLSRIGLVSAVDEMLEYLVRRIDDLSSILEQNM